MKFNIWYFLFFIIISKSSFAQEKVIGIIENDADSKPISNVHVINLNSVVGTISNKEGVFEIDANVNDTLFFSYLGFKSIKVASYDCSSFQLIRELKSNFKKLSDKYYIHCVWRAK